MLTEDYIMRMINLALAALLKALRLKKKGEYDEAHQALDQAFEQLSGLPPSVFKQLEDESLLAALSPQGKVDIGRLVVLADLFMEEGEVFDLQNLPEEGTLSAGRALRLALEAALSDEYELSRDRAGKIETLRSRLREQNLPLETQLALYDYYSRLAGSGELERADLGLTQETVEAVLSELRKELGPALGEGNG